MSKQRTVQHTPGPWKLNKRLIFNVEDQNGRTIARVNFDPETYDEAMANVHLIAAAPDLLEACEAALDAIINNPIDEFLTPEEEDAVEKLSVAIAKARGEDIIGENEE